MQIKPALGAIAAICLLAVFAWRQTYTNSFAPNSVFTTLKGEQIALETLRGHPVLVTFWATDCPGCIEEIPDLIALHEQFKSKGLLIIAVAMPYDPPSQVKALTEARQLPYAVALDLDGRHVKAFGDVQLTPTSFMINREGGIVFQAVGRFDLPSWQAYLAAV